MYSIPVKYAQTEEELEYIGVTERKIATRLEEHNKDIMKGRLSMSLSMEAYSRDLTIAWQRSKRIRAVTSGMQPTIAGSIEIERRKVTRKLIDDKTSWELPLAWKYALSMEIRKETRGRREQMEDESGC